MRENKNMNKKGFTLVELLAVIVILAIVLVIAVPKVMSIISDSKKATLENTAKMIAGSAEKAKIQNTVLGKEETISCESVSKYNKEDYESCSIEFDGNTAKVTIKGKGKFAGLNVCSGTKTGAVAQEDACVDPLEVKHSLFLPGQQIKPESFEVTLNEDDGTKRILEDGTKLALDNSKTVTITSPNWPNNYPDNMTEEENYWELEFEGAESIQITFDETSKVQSSYNSIAGMVCNDDIKIYNKAGILLKSQICEADLAGKTYEFAGDYIKVTMKSNGSTNYKGFSATITPIGKISEEYTVSPAVAPSATGDFDIIVTTKDGRFSKKITTNVGPHDVDEYITSLEKVDTSLVKTTATYSGKDYDAGIRYIGASDAVNNNVYFNCETTYDGKDYGSEGYKYNEACETWRIIGVFEVDDGNGNSDNRLKIINTKSTFSASWDSSASDINNGNGVNQWGETTYEDADGVDQTYLGADLKQLLDGYYIGKSGSECKFNNASGQSGFAQNCTAESLKNANMKVLTTEAKKMIDNALWDTYAINYGTPNSYGADKIYLQEKGISMKLTGKDGCSPNIEATCNDTVGRTISWKGQVGLMNLSDMKYADGWLVNNVWTINAYRIQYQAASSDGSSVWYTPSSSAKAYTPKYVYPTLYLRPNVKITGGNGGSHPYTLAIDES